MENMKDGYGNVNTEEDISVPATRPEGDTVSVQVGNQICVSLDSLLPEDELAISESLGTAIAKAREKGLFSPAAGMMQIQNKLDGQIYAAVRVDANGLRYIDFCQRYGDNSFSPRMSLAQADLLFAARHNYLPEGIGVPLQKVKLGKFLATITDEYFGKFAGDTQLEIIDVLNTLCRALPSLPVISEYDGELTAEQLYADVKDVLTRVTLVAEHKAYYAIYDEQLRYIASELGMGHRELLKKLAEYGLLYLPESAKGYQARVRISATETAWMYCIFRVEYIVGLQ